MGAPYLKIPVAFELPRRELQLFPAARTGNVDTLTQLLHQKNLTHLLNAGDSVRRIASERDI
jgi:hypothetical protein